MQEHHEDERQVAELTPHINALADALAHDTSSTEPSEPAKAALATLQPLMEAHLEYVLMHLRHEEDELSPLLRKSLSITSMRDIVRQVCTMPSDHQRAGRKVIPAATQHCKLPAPT